MSIFDVFGILAFLAAFGLLALCGQLTARAGRLNDQALAVVKRSEATRAEVQNLLATGLQPTVLLTERDEWKAIAERMAAARDTASQDAERMLADLGDALDATGTWPELLQQVARLRSFAQAEAERLRGRG